KYDLWIPKWRQVSEASGFPLLAQRCALSSGVCACANSTSPDFWEYQSNTSSLNLALVESSVVDRRDICRRCGIAVTICAGRPIKPFMVCLRV
ncbi:MAG: hypothetical protein LBJ35_05320, partial [Spirochaetaceae bacterium]|nr:hypothetical protein [Spirochaetaceae bacterium]